MTEHPVLPDYFRISFEDEGSCLSFNAFVSSAESMTRLIELIKVCRSHMACDKMPPTDELDATLRTILEPQASEWEP